MEARTPWTALYEPGVPSSAPVPEGPFHGILDQAAAGAPTFPALSFYGRRVTYADLAGASDRVAAALRASPGFQLGAVVAVDLPNCPHLASAALGTWKAGAVLWAPGRPTEAPGSGREPLVWITTAERLAARWGRGGPGAPVVLARPATALPATLRWLRRAGRRAGPGPVPGAQDWEAWLRAAAGRPLAAKDAPVPAEAAALLAPGAEGAPTLFSHRQLMAGAALLRLWLTDAVVGDETWLLLADLGTPLGLVAGLGTALTMRSQLVLLPDWSAGDGLEALRYARPDYVLADAATCEALVAEPDLARLDLDPVRAVLVGEPVHPRTARDFQEATGVSLCLGYAPAGMAGLATCNPVNARRAPGSLGLPLPGVDARVVGPDGRAARAGEAGVLELIGPHGPPGWLRTGLLARQDAEGHLYAAGWPGSEASAARRLGAAVAGRT